LRAGTDRAAVVAGAVGRSFYEQLFPTGTVALGWSATAAVWLRSTPCELPGHLFSFTATGDERATWRAAAAGDWRTFLSQRARELRVGGGLVVSLPVAGSGYLDWMHVAEPALVSSHDPARDATDRSATTDAFFACIRDRLADTPTDCPWTIGILRVGRVAA
jgi:hypothetical protein